MLIVFLGISAMVLELAIVTSFQYQFIRRGAENTLASQHKVIESYISEAMLYDNIFDMYSLLKASTDAHEFIKNIYLFDSSGRLVVDALTEGGWDESMREGWYFEYKILAKNEVIGEVVYVLNSGYVNNAVALQFLETCLFFLILLGAGLVFATKISVFITEPLLSLSNEINKFTLDNLPEKIETDKYATTEIKALAETLGNMSRTLKDALNEIYRQSEQLKRSERLATVGTMAAGLAHELKNPIMTINLLSMSLKENHSDPQSAEDLAVMRKESDRIVATLNDFLSLSRPMEVKPEKISAHAVTAYLVQYVKSRFKDSLTATVQAGSNIGFVSDPEKLYQVMISMVHNSAEAGATKVHFGFGRESGFAVFEISDNGCGIPQEKQSKIFMPFYTSKATGTGLGLTYTEMILEILGGGIELDKEYSGGAKFIIKVKDHEKDTDN
ncbi:ATP-binding protein [Geovibrio thiophilus]|nr:ATP-binding protein [Geovibrio thiophilus]